jgi:hypothetical protein
MPAGLPAPAGPHEEGRGADGHQGVSTDPLVQGYALQ